MQHHLNLTTIDKKSTCLTYAFDRSNNWKDMPEVANFVRSKLTSLDNLYFLEKLVIPENSVYVNQEGQILNQTTMKIGDIFILKNRFSDKDMVIKRIHPDGTFEMDYCTGGIHAVVVEKVNRHDATFTFSSLSIKDFKPSIQVYTSKVLYERFGDGHNNLLLKAIT